MRLRWEKFSVSVVTCHTSYIDRCYNLAFLCAIANNVLAMSNDEDYHMLGAALFGPSAHHPSPPQCLPEAWRSSLTRNHLDAHSRQTVFQSCVSGRDLVLEVAEQASLRITWHTAWPRQLSLFNRSLQTRGALPTTLIISCDDQVRSGASPCTVWSLWLSVGEFLHREA